MTASELATRPAFQIFLKCSRLAFRFECNRSFNSPWTMCRAVRTFPSIVFEQPLLKVSRDASVVERVARFADENVNVEKGVHLLACQAVVFGALREKTKMEARLHFVTAWQPPLWNAMHYRLVRLAGLPSRSLFCAAKKRRLGPPGFEPGTKGL